MKQYKISKENFIDLDNHLTISHVNIGNALNLHLKQISDLINSFNKEYKWDEMFTISDVEDRLKNNSDLFILYHINIPIGYVFFKEIDSKTCFGYNLYVTKLTKRPPESALWFYRRVTKIMLNKYDFIRCEIEDWNQVVDNIVKSIGYSEIV